MAELQADDLGDLVATTQKRLGRMKFTELATDSQQFVAYDQLVRRNKMEIGSGYGIQFDIMVNSNGSARFVGLAAQDQVNQVDVMIQGTVPFRNLTANYPIIGQEIDMNADPERIVKLVETRRIACMIDIVKKIEDRFWKCPL